MGEPARNDECRDKDIEMKTKAKVFADKRRNAEIVELAAGDNVLLKQNKKRISIPLGLNQNHTS